MSKLNFKLREMRKEENLTQEELAEKSGVSRVTISQIESGQTNCVKTDTLVKLADALNKKVGDLFF